MLEIMHDVSISARLTTTTTKVGWWSVGDHARCIHLSTVNYNYDISARLTTTTTKVGWWSIGDHARCIHLSTVNYNYDVRDELRRGGMVEYWRRMDDVSMHDVNYNYDEGGMVEYWRSCTMYPSQHG